MKYDELRAKATPGGWMLKSCPYGIYTKDGTQVAECKISTARDAELIVHQHKHFDQMREALQAIIDECPNPKYGYGNNVVTIARAVLKAVDEVEI